MGIFSLMRTSAKIGEDIVGVFDFSSGTVPCLQVYFVADVTFTQEAAVLAVACIVVFVV